MLDRLGLALVYPALPSTHTLLLVVAGGGACCPDTTLYDDPCVSLFLVAVEMLYVHTVGEDILPGSYYEDLWLFLEMVESFLCKVDSHFILGGSTRQELLC